MWAALLQSCLNLSATMMTGHHSSIGHSPSTQTCLSVAKSCKWRTGPSCTCAHPMLGRDQYGYIKGPYYMVKPGPMPPGQHNKVESKKHHKLGRFPKRRKKSLLRALNLRPQVIVVAFSCEPPTKAVPVVAKPAPDFLLWLGNYHPTLQVYIPNVMVGTRLRHCGR